jgi:hypothetical protein
MNRGRWTTLTPVGHVNFVRRCGFEAIGGKVVIGQVLAVVVARQIVNVNLQ